MKPEQIKLRAEELLSKLGVTSAHVNVHDIARSLGIEILEQPELDGELSGALVIKNRKGVVGLNASEHNLRKRFTLAHELGHFCLHYEEKDTFLDEVIAFNRSPETNQQEIEANQFAANLLMPEAFITSEVKTRFSSKISERNVSELANVFKVSEIAMTYRLVNMRLI